MNDADVGRTAESVVVVLPQNLPVIVPAPTVEDRVEHLIELREVGPFTTAWCAGCDWRSFARRSRPLARTEGADHARLFAPSPMGQGS